MTAEARHKDDELLTMPEISTLTKTPEGTLRYQRHIGQADFLFKRAGRLVAWKSEVMAWLDEQRAADEEQRSFAGRPT